VRLVDYLKRNLLRCTVTCRESIYIYSAFTHQENLSDWTNENEVGLQCVTLAARFPVLWTPETHFPTVCCLLSLISSVLLPVFKFVLHNVLSLSLFFLCSVDKEVTTFWLNHKSLSVAVPRRLRGILGFHTDRKGAKSTACLSPA